MVPGGLGTQSDGVTGESAGSMDSVQGQSARGVGRAGQEPTWVDTAIRRGRPQNVLLQASNPPPPSSHSWVQTTKNQKQVCKHTLVTHIQSSTVHSSPKAEAAQEAIRGRASQHHVVRPQGNVIQHAAATFEPSL